VLWHLTCSCGDNQGYTLVLLSWGLANARLTGQLHDVQCYTAATLAAIAAVHSRYGPPLLLLMHALAAAAAVCRGGQRRECLMRTLVPAASVQWYLW
jgi:hypothetical protein